MFYKIQNYFLEKKIFKIKIMVINLLKQDIKTQEEIGVKINNKDTAILLAHRKIEDVIKNINIIKQRLNINKQYKMLHNHFRNDSKRKYIINHNFYKFLKAIKYLYITSNININRGILTAPNEIYYAINAVEDCFNKLIKEYEL